MPIYIDIETSKAEPLDWMIPDVANEDPPGNYKKPEAIEKWREERAANVVDEIYDRSSLEALLGGFVVCVGIAVDLKPITVLVNETLDEAGELAMLQKLEKGLGKYPSDPLVAWHGIRFDYQFLRHRAIRHGLYVLARRFWAAKPWDRKLLDPFVAWQGPDRTTKGHQKEVARFLGIEVTDTTTGKDVQRFLDAGDIASVKAHCIEDVRVLREIFTAFAAAGWVEGEDPDCYAPLAPAEPRRTLRQQVGDAMLETGTALVQDAASAAEVPWRTGTEVGEAGPVLEGLPPAVLRRFLHELRTRRVAA